MTIQIQATRLVDAPIVPPSGEAGLHNVNGPSLLRVPAWFDGALARYYLYFADHKGRDIRLAVADELAGPWRLHQPAPLHLRDTPFLQVGPPVPEDVDAESLAVPRAPGVPSLLDDCVIPHIASPEVVLDEATRSVRLYYHGLDGFAHQVTRVAVSNDGLHFESGQEVLSPPYLRVFRYRDHWYGLSMPGRFVRSRDGLSGFEPGPTLFGTDMRHAGLWLRGDTLWVFWTRVGDAPEQILLSTIDLRPDWMDWRESDEIEVLRPERPWEGANAPLEPSVRSSVDRPVNQLRDPYLLVDDDDPILVYAVAGESGLGIARLTITQWDDEEGQP